MNFEFDEQALIEKKDIENPKFSDLIEKIKTAKARGVESISSESSENMDLIKEKITGYAEQLEKIKFDDYLKFIEPEGGDGRSFEQELDFYKECQEQGVEHKVVISYPHINFEEEVVIKDIELKMAKYIEIEEEVDREENVAIRNMFKEMITISKNRIELLFKLCEFNKIEKEISEENPEDINIASLLEKRENIEDECFVLVTAIYGNLDDDLIKKAKDASEEINRELDADNLRSEIEETLIANKFDADDLAREFNFLFKRAGLDNCIAVVDKEKKNCETSINDQEHGGKTVIKVPEKYNDPKFQINGLKLLQLLVHETTHVITGEFQLRELGLGSINFGRNASDVKEGIAVLSEIKVTNTVLGEDRMRNKAHPYYLMAMDKIRTESNDGKGNINVGEIYDFLYEAIKRDFSKNKGFSEDQIRGEAKKILRRVLRAVPGCRHFNTKDMIYFKGEEIAKVLEDTEYLSYVEKCYIDPELVPVFIELGIYDLSEAEQLLINGYKDALSRIVEQGDFHKKFSDRLLWRLFARWEKLEDEEEEV
ncbi:MAG: hypothetical protein PHI66_02985 [Candidatus Pacebacteria bacterium]|nr:hypothetical protein [Candidatus Paceibacterota bacterium]